MMRNPEIFIREMKISERISFFLSSRKKEMRAITRALRLPAWHQWRRMPRARADARRK
jgi:hypothetical protein